MSKHIEFLSLCELIGFVSMNFHNLSQLLGLSEFKAVFARAGGATYFNLVKNQSRGHFQACPRAQKQTENAQIGHL